MRRVLVRAAVLLAANPVIVLPSLVIGAASATIARPLEAAGISSWSFFGDLDAQGVQGFWEYAATIVALGLRVLAALAAIAFTTGMAGAAWTSGRARLRDGASAFARRGPQALAALTILFLTGLGASVLAVPTFGISVVVYAALSLYAMPAAIVGARPATDAVIESMRLTWRNAPMTLALVALIVVLAVAGGLAGRAAAGIPVLGEAVGWIVMEAVVAYATLVVVGEYLKLESPAQAP